jgi:hypothetical protein
MWQDTSLSNLVEWPAQLDGLQAAPTITCCCLRPIWSNYWTQGSRAAERVRSIRIRWPSGLYVLSWSDFVRRDDVGRAILGGRLSQTPPLGTAMWSSPLPPHTLENVGESELPSVIVELKKAGLFELEIQR